jgi:thiamine pyrophosphokinase
MTLLDEQNLIRYLQAGKHEIPQIDGYKYVGFVQVGSDDTLAISRAKYPLKAEENFAQIYASNEFIAETMSVNFARGMVIVIYSHDKN